MSNETERDALIPRADGPRPVPQLRASNELHAEAIFTRLLPELMALPVERLLSVNLNVVVATTTVRRQMPRLLELRDELVRTCTDFDAQALDRLSEYTWALQHAHALLQTAAECGEVSLGTAGRRRKPSAAERSVNELQRRAFTLFFRTYNEVRMAVSYVRRNHGDAKELAPSLLGGARRARSKRPNGDEPEPRPELKPGVCSSERRAPSRGSWYRG